MIALTKIDGYSIVVNADEIETIESAHNSTITFKSGKKLVVREDSSVIIKKTIEYKKQCYSALPEIK